MGTRHAYIYFFGITCVASSSVRESDLDRHARRQAQLPPPHVDSSSNVYVAKRECVERNSVKYPNRIRSSVVERNSTHSAGPAAGLAYSCSRNGNPSVFPLILACCCRHEILRFSFEKGDLPASRGGAKGREEGRGKKVLKIAAV